MMITVIVDEIVDLNTSARSQGAEFEPKWKRVEREKFSAVANIINNIAVAGDVLWLSEGRGAIPMTIVRARPLVRTNSGGARELGLWLDVVSPEMLRTIGNDNSFDRVGALDPSASQLQAIGLYPAWAKHHEVW